MRRTITVAARISIELAQQLEDLGKKKFNKNRTDTLRQIIEESVTRHLESQYCKAQAELNEGFYCLKNAPETVKLGDGSFHDSTLICEACKHMGGPLKEEKAQ